MSKILVTGGSGLVGRHLKKYLPAAVYLSSKDFDLTRENEVIKLYEQYRPSAVVHLAARVGGIIDNIKYPADYFTSNVLMNTLLIDYAHKYDVERFIGVLSTCVYPDIVENYPLTEENLYDGSPAATNFSYGYAKRCMAVQIDSYNTQYGTKYNYLIPCNLYGEGDKDELATSHFVTALIKKIYDANASGEDSITLFGDGTPLRQFLHVDDFVKVIAEVLDKNIYESFNVATEENYSIEQIAKIALKACDSENLKINFDESKPNGQFRKDVSIEKLKSVFPGYEPLPLAVGIKRVYEHYDKISQRHD